MDISPMNLQMMVPKSTEVGEMQHNMQHQVNMQHDSAVHREKDDVMLKEKQVRSKEKADEGKIKEEQERKKGSGGRKDRHRMATPEEGEDDTEDTIRFAVDPSRGQHIDISL